MIGPNFSPYRILHKPGQEGTSDLYPATAVRLKQTVDVKPDTIRRNRKG